jgi:anti-anti-sigma regulatory factor
MIKVRDDRPHDAVIVEFAGDVDIAQARRSFGDVKKLVARHGKGFKVLVDFSSVATMDVDVEGEMKETMKFINAKGVGEIIRVLPDPELAVGFNYMSRFFYSKDVKLVNFTSREQAQQCLSDGESSPE